MRGVKSGVRWRYWNVGFGCLVGNILLIYFIYKLAYIYKTETHIYEISIYYYIPTAKLYRYTIITTIDKPLGNL